jgi:hypothetical protein
MIFSSHSVNGTNPYNTSYKTPRFKLIPQAYRKKKGGASFWLNQA